MIIYIGSQAESRYNGNSLILCEFTIVGEPDYTSADVGSLIARTENWSFHTACMPSVNADAFGRKERAPSRQSFQLVMVRAIAGIDLIDVLITMH